MADKESKENLPPDALRQLHFQRIPSALIGRSPPPAASVPPVLASPADLFIESPTPPIPASSGDIAMWRSAPPPLDTSLHDLLPKHFPASSQPSHPGFDVHEPVACQSSSAEHIQRWLKRSSGGWLAWTLTIIGFAIALIVAWKLLF